MIDHALWILALLFVKHAYVDFFIQTDEEVASKGLYGDKTGIWHSVKHGIGTLMVLLLCAITVMDSLLLAILDSVIHYHVDWAKININKKYSYTAADPEFWRWIGVDQMLHAFTYLFIVWSLF